MTTHALLFLSCLGTLATSEVLPEERISNGFPAEEGQFPWFVGLTTGEDKYQCGGTLLDSLTVLTAAHCTYKVNTENLTAHIGAMHRNPIIAAESIPVADIIMHPNFTSFGGHWDVAVLKLEHEATLSDFMEVIPDFIDDGTELTAIGIGLDENNQDVYELRYTSLVTLPWKEYCDSFPTNYPPTHYDPDMQLCMSASTNSGDSGGPYLIQANNKYYEVALTSRGLLETEQATRLSFYYDWILDHME